MKNLKLSTLALLFLTVLASCKKESPTPEPFQPAQQPTPYYVRMTDAPGPYSAVYVDVQSVVITGNGNDVTLNTNAGIYNLLNFTNGTDTLLASANLYTDKVEQIRLILGPNNSLVKDGVTYPLSVPSGEQSGLKLNVHHTLQAGVAYNILLDFDANKSIIQTGNGTYKLKPVIRTIEAAVSGSIKGHISPTGVIASVTATHSNGETYSSFVNANGYFIIGGLPAGTYTLTIDPLSPYFLNTVNNVNVSIGQTTDVGQINL